MKHLVTLTTDFGTKDSYAAEVKAVLYSGSPHICCIDITHEIPPYEIEWGAFQLLRSYSHFPAGTIHLAIVDPGVGTSRRAIFVEVGGYRFTGPDNGILLWAVRDAERKTSKKAKVYGIPDKPPVSPTFHGRDVFAPFIVEYIKSTQALALSKVGLNGVDFPTPKLAKGKIQGEVIGWDHYGNVITSIPWTVKDIAYGTVGNRAEKLKVAENYQSIQGSAALIRGSHGFWEISCRMNSAKDYFGIRKGEPFSLQVK